MEEQTRYLELTQRAKDAGTAYYDNDDPIMSDYEYDALMQEIKAIEKAHPEYITADSPTQHVGGTPSQSSFKKVAHKVPMLSLRDVFSMKDVDDFTQQFPANALFSVEEKIDGLSLSALFKNGVLTQAVTRGDGLFIGEDVTENAMCVTGIPHKLRFENSMDNVPSLLEVRCEVYMPVERFTALNKEREEQGQKLFANPRNAAAGLLRTKNVEAVRKGGLCALAFNIQRCQGESRYGQYYVDQHSSLQMLKSLGFAVVTNYVAPACRIHEFIDKIGEYRNGLAYWTDGAVIKAQLMTERERLGETAKYPRWAVAYKYPPEEKETVIRDIILQTGRTGRITPVAVFDPVFLAGTKVEKATLHNPEIVAKLGVNVGDTVLVRKAAEIIPEVIKVTKKETAKVYNIFAHHCPSCGSGIVAGADENGENESGAYCINPECPAQLARRFEFWCSRDCMDIRGLGPAQIEKFISLGWLKEIPDIYRLTEHRDEMAALDGFGHQSADKLLAAIEKSKNNDIDRLIKALGILGVGRHIGKSLAKRYPNIHSIAASTIYVLSQTEGVGDISAQAIYEWFNDIGETNHKEMLYELESLGVNMKSLGYGISTAAKSRVLEDKTFVITGTLPTMKREDASTLIEANGGKVSGSVSKKTDYLLCGEAAGSKLDKANALGIKVISEEEFKKMLA